MVAISGAWSSYGPSGSQPISSSALASLLLKSKLERLFFLDDAMGIKSAALWEYSFQHSISKQTGATYLAPSTNGRNNSHFGDSEFDLTLQKHYDAICNLGLVISLPGIIGVKDAGSADGIGGKVVSVDGASLPGCAPAGAAAQDGQQAALADDSATGHSLDLGKERLASGHLAHKLCKLTSTIAAGDGYAAYCPFAQYVVIEKVSFNINQQEVLNFTGVDLLILTDIYGIGQQSLDILAYSELTSNSLEVRAGESCTDKGHIVSLALWFERGSSFALHPSIDSASHMEFKVSFRKSEAIIQKDAAGTGVLHASSTGATPVALKDSDFKAAWIFDAYHFSTAEKAAYTAWEANQGQGRMLPYRKSKSNSQEYANPGPSDQGYMQFQPPFIGADIIMYATKQSELKQNYYAKFGFGGSNDDSVQYLEKATVSLNANDSQSISSATTLWNQMMGSRHISRLGALVYTVQPGFPLFTIAECSPVATMPFARMEHVQITPSFCKDVNEPVKLNALYSVYSALHASGAGQIGPMFH